MGLAELKKAIKGREEYLASGKSKGGGGNFTYTPRINFREGQTKRVRFNGPINEPLVLRFHQFNDEYNPILCAYQFEAPQDGDEARDDGTFRGQYAHLLREPHAGCVYCFQYRAVKDKRIGFSTKAAYSLVDQELYHAVPNERGVTDKDGNVYINDELCSNNGRCPYCRSPDVNIQERFYGGQKKWEMPMKSAMALMGQIENIEQYCSCCWQPGAAVGSGIIQTISYTCPNDGCRADIPIDSYDPHASLFHKCAACNETVVPLETCSCTNGCEDARRTTMWDGDWQVTRTGTSTLTSYSFHFLGVSAPPQWVLDLDVPDLSAEEKPSSADKMAKKLGIENPFATVGHGGGNRQQVPGHAPAPRQGPAPALAPRHAIQPQTPARVAAPPVQHPFATAPVARPAAPPQRAPVVPARVAAPVAPARPAVVAAPSRAMVAAMAPRASAPVVAAPKPLAIKTPVGGGTVRKPLMKPTATSDSIDYDDPASVSGIF